MTQRYVALHGGGGVGCMTQRYVTPAFILPDNFVLPCRFALIQNGVPASQKRCYSSCLRSKTLIYYHLSDRGTRGATCVLA